MTTPIQQGDVIASRYQVVGMLGQGGIGTTYAAMDQETGSPVALKALSLRQMKDFKVLELFEREARILQQIQHPAIPCYLNYFEVDHPQERYFYIAQQLAEGQSLAAWVEQGWQPDEAIVRDVAEQVLEILVYLQQLVPPILHRDIKPHNIIRREDGRLFLVDFGAVQDTYHNTLTAGSTMVGTYGYMAPEQFRGQATLATDLYSLGATLLFLLTRQDPADLPQRKLRIQFRPHVQVSGSFADWLDHLLDPIAEERFHSAAQALAVLRGEEVYSRTSYRMGRKPGDCSVSLKQNGTTLQVEVPPIWLQNRLSRYFAGLPIAANSVALLLFLIVSVMTLGSLKSATVGVWLILGGSMLAGLLILVRFLQSAAITLRLEITPETVKLERSLWKFPLHTIRGKTKDLRLKVVPIWLKLTHQQTITTCVLQVQSQSYPFGTLLAESEKAWLVKELQAFLQAVVPRQ